jgi:hypothetical protein
LEVPLILCDKGERVVERSGSDEDIRVADNLALLSQGAADNGKPMGNLAIDGE